MIRRIPLAVAGAIAILAASAAPTTGALPPPTGLEINAIPGTRIDICSKGVERRSNLRWTRGAAWDPIRPLTATWSVRKAKAGTCTGKRLARFTYTFEPGRSYVIVYWKPKDVVKMQVHDVTAPPTEPGRSSLRVIHAAKAGPIDVWFWQKVPAPADLLPTIDYIKKGHAAAPMDVPAYETVVSVLPDGKAVKWDIAGGAHDLAPDTAYQVVFMGSTARNMTVEFFLPVAP